MNVFVAIVGLGFLVLIHEAGHFFTAIWVGMRPRSFNIGFGPPLDITRQQERTFAVGYTQDDRVVVVGNGFGIRRWFRIKHVNRNIAEHHPVTTGNYLDRYAAAGEDT